MPSILSCGVSAYFADVSILIVVEIKCQGIFFSGGRGGPSKVSILIVVEIKCQVQKRVLNGICSFGFNPYCSGN